MLQQIQANIDSHRNRLSGQRTAHSPQSQSENNKRLWGQAMIDTLADMGMPVQPASPTSAK